MEKEQGERVKLHFPVFSAFLPLKQFATHSPGAKLCCLLQRTRLAEGDALAHQLQLVLILDLPINHTVSRVFHNRVDKRYCSGIQI